MKLMFLLVFSFIALILSRIPSSTTAEKSKWLVQYGVDVDQKFELNEDALSKLSHLRKPVKVISVIGEARVGKSTTLNFVRHILNCDGKDEAEIEANVDKFELNENALSQLSNLPKPVKVIPAIGEARLYKSTTLNSFRHILNCDGKHETEIAEVFKTGDSLKPVTRGIWMSVCEKQNIVLLDVEGINLASDSVTSHMSVFTSLMSSGIVVFSSRTVTNDILNFLYGVIRLNEHIFKDIDNNNNFGHLHIVIRDQLSPSPGKTFEDEVRDMIIKPSGENETTDKKRRAIAKYFHKDNITVSEIPLIDNRELLKNIKIKKNEDFWNTIRSLSWSFKNFPAKTTLRSNLVDGKALVQIARTLIEMMNKNSWLDFGDNYAMVEKYLNDQG